VQRRRRLIAILIAALVALGGLFFIQRDHIWPAKDPLQTPTATRALPTLTATARPPTMAPSPLPADWDLSQELAHWQKVKVMGDLDIFWNVFMSPEGPPDCATARETAYSRNKTIKVSIDEICAENQASGTYEKVLPLYAFRSVSFFTSPEQGSVVVRLDSLTAMPIEFRYLLDGGLFDVVIVPRTIYEVLLALEVGEDRWAVAGVGVDQIQEGENQ
jgi:hypothetical protein